MTREKIISETVATALAASIELNKATDRLNDAIRGAEHVIAELKLGVVVAVDLEANGWTLEFAKWDKNWRLLFVVGEEEQLLTSAPREARLLAVTKLPDLVLALKGALTAELTRVRAATEAAERFVEDLKEKS